MPLHHTHEHEDNASADAYLTHAAGANLPKYRMPDAMSPAKSVYQLLRDELLLDGNSRQNLATFCTTWVEPEVEELMTAALDKNMIDKDEYPQTAEIESRCVHILADLWHAPRSWETVGCSTTGSSEAAMLGGLALKWNWRKRRAAEGKATDKPNLVTGPVQICWKKFCRYFDVELREIPLEGDAQGMKPQDLRTYVDENTIGVVPTLGVTFTGVYEPVEAIVKELDHIQQETGLDIPVHVDGASGAFIAPFIHEEVTWDFYLERVVSINASGHKYGLAPLGVGWVVWRSRECLPEELVFNVDYLGGDMPTFALNFSRPGGEIIAQYYNFLRLGREGYRQVQQTSAKVAQKIAKEIEKIGIFEILYDGHGALPAVAYKLKDDDHGFTLYDLSERIRVHGWQIASYPLPENRQDEVVQRIMVRHGVTADLADLLIRDFKAALAHLQANPVPNSSAKATYHH